MTIRETIDRLSRIRRANLDTEHIGQTGAANGDAKACETAIRILAALRDEGCCDLDTVLDLLEDYRSIARAHREMFTRIRYGKRPVNEDGKCYCADCGRRIGVGDDYCKRCGAKLDWGARGEWKP